MCIGSEFMKELSEVILDSVSDNAPKKYLIEIMIYKFYL